MCCKRPSLRCRRKTASSYQSRNLMKVVALTGGLEFLKTFYFTVSESDTVN